MNSGDKHASLFMFKVRICCKFIAISYKIILDKLIREIFINLCILIIWSNCFFNKYSSKKKILALHEGNKHHTCIFLNITHLHV